MKETQLLENFESKYMFLYKEMVHGVPLYTCVRDDVLHILQTGCKITEQKKEKGHIYFRRIFDGIIKTRKLRNSKTLIFTSSVYRRDYGRNLAVEYLMDCYPEAAVFEWPARVDEFDTSYFSDPQKGKFCPLDYYVIIYKLLSILKKNSIKKRENRLREELIKQFNNAPSPDNEKERAAVDFVVTQLPVYLVTTEISQKIFSMLFKHYYNVQHAIDFWGSGRENIFTELNGKPEKIELQHGIITMFHPGYIYPSFVKKVNTDFFSRKLLVYGNATKKILTKESIFDEINIQVIGNPRIRKYKEIYFPKAEERNLILFTSQGQGYGEEYYVSIITYLRKIEEYICKHSDVLNYKMAIKLHPNESKVQASRYRNALRNSIVYDNSAQLYELLNKSVLHLTVTSTALFEAAAFDVPTILIPYKNFSDTTLYGFKVWKFKDVNDVPTMLNELQRKYKSYLYYLKEKSREYC